MTLALDTVSIGFSMAHAKACANASKQAYESVTIESPLAHVLILEDETANIVAFRGTANLRDALTDAECWRDGHIHSGFAAAFNSIALPLSDALKNFTEKPLFFTGHSLGGAQAVLAAYQFGCDALYTFGQPRVGDRGFARECTSRFGPRHFRFVNQEDIVPRVPGYLAGFRHSGQEIFFSSTGGMRFGAPLWMKLLSDVYGTYLEYRLKQDLAQLADHAIDKYTAQLSELTG